MNPVGTTFYGPEEVKDLLRELARRLQTLDVAADIYLVGGAAIAVEYSSRRSTTDIDAVYQPEQTVNEVARAMAKDMGLDPKWLNSSAKPWVPNATDAEAATVPVAENLTLRVASPRFLLAMKMAAGRDRDIYDIAVLCNVLGIQSAQEAVEIALELYGEDSMQLSNQEDLLLVAQEALDTII